MRIIHGKGKGILKKKVQAVLRKHPLVIDFKEAGHGAGGWGATLVELGRSKPAG